ncbi:MAG: hypothetical protein HFI93_01485 [Lachnospiraceae bacterium]|nr:hypothetical protein [Lachnospiraceae bacterium]
MSVPFRIDANPEEQQEPEFYRISKGETLRKEVVSPVVLVSFRVAAAGWQIC